MKVYELLEHGKENAVTGKQLAQRLDIDLRTVVKEIEIERRSGQPICASSRGEHIGYYLAVDQEELENYCKRFRRRAAEMEKTQKAMAKGLQQAKQEATGREEGAA